jgi:hypothetical protein
MSITWRDVAAPDFRGAAAIAAGANDAIQSGIKGLTSTFDRFGQQFVDKDTNAAVKAAMGLGNVNTVDADAARILASSGQDVDLAKYNAAVLQKADALRGTERFNREGQTFDQNIKIGNQNLTKGEQDIAANTAKALRQSTLDMQADKVYGYTVDQQEFDKVHRPEIHKKNMAQIDADINQSNAAAGASGASANLSNAQIKKLQTEQADANIVKEGIAGFSLANTDVKTLDRNKLSSLIAKDPRYAKHSRAILDGVLASRGDDLDKADLLAKNTAELAAIAKATAGREAALKRGAAFIPSLATDRWYVHDNYNNERRAKFEGMYATALQQGADEGKLGAFMLNEQSKNDEYFNVNNNISPDEMQVKINAWMSKNYPPK